MGKNGYYLRGAAISYTFLLLCQVRGVWGGGCWLTCVSLTTLRHSVGLHLTVLGCLGQHYLKEQRVPPATPPHPKNVLLLSNHDFRKGTINLGCSYQNHESQSRFFHPTIGTSHSIVDNCTPRIDPGSTYFSPSLPPWSKPPSSLS